MTMLNISAARKKKNNPRTLKHSSEQTNRTPQCRALAHRQDSSFFHLTMRNAAKVC